MTCPRCGKPVEQHFCMVTDEHGKDLCRACGPKRYAEILVHLKVEELKKEQYMRVGFAMPELLAFLELMSEIGSGEVQKRARNLFFWIAEGKVTL